MMRPTATQPIAVRNRHMRHVQTLRTYDLYLCGRARMGRQADGQLRSSSVRLPTLSVVFSQQMFKHDQAEQYLVIVFAPGLVLYPQPLNRHMAKVPKDERLRVSKYAFHVIG